MQSFAELAERERLRREAERGEAEAEAAQERAERAADRALRDRDKALREARALLSKLGHAVQVVLERDGELEVAAQRAGQRFQPVAQTMAELVAIECRDAGLNHEPIGYVRAATRALLLERFPREGRRDATASVARPRCSVCQHQDRRAIDAALATGTSYRDAAVRFGLSRSSLSRHAHHAGRS